MLLRTLPPEGLGPSAVADDDFWRREPVAETSGGTNTLVPLTALSAAAALLVELPVRRARSAANEFSGRYSIGAVGGTFVTPGAEAAAESESRRSKPGV